LALGSFICSFAAARTFTTFYANVVLVRGHIHVHHFWYGLVLLVLGGWLGISYDSERVSRVAAILFGVGGGLIGDEVGLLATWGNYWTEITYTFVIIIVALASMIILVSMYHEVIRREFTEFLRSNASLYFGVFLAAVSITFILETDNVTIIIISSLLTVAASIILLVYFFERIRHRHRRN
jgi:hypothetical protein